MQGKVAIDPDWNFVNVDNTKMLVQNYPVQQIISTKKTIKDQILGIQKTANHTIIWVNINGFPVLDTNGEITEIVISFNDITNSKIAEDSLKNNQKLLSETEKIGNVGGWEYYYDSGILNWTEETYNIHELQYDKNLSLDAGINYYTPEAIPIINNAVQQAIEFSIPFDLELEIITAKGNKRSVHSICKIDSEHKRIFGFFQDITERKKAEEQISIQLNELRRWYEVTLDREGRVMELKREVNELLKMHGEALRYGSTTEGNSETISNV
jgi:PAS domain-containing protein